MFDDSLERAADDLEQRSEGLKQKAQVYGDLQSRMQALSATESVANGQIRVTVNGNGIPTAIDLAPGIRMDSAALSREIMACMHRAQATLRGQVTELVQGTVGEDLVGDSIIDQYSRQFPEPEQDLPAPPSDPAPTPSYTPPPAFTTGPEAVPGSRTPNRDQVFTPEDPDDDDYYRRKSWMV
ncbi:YbaB/EbfC family nucleoid-associated protein [Nocardia nova]|uniref:YbaB/EbfC DNA-binding family protein n=1 Tax=Nocardia nova SH22a TaxID=1415166 RepID=W5TTT2_9NOCA|nr:YbaB/EbfC family nucleoid-associated protein [Nocardia nova]AHH20606.1 hypothetical protein NONO_c58290 [Nocardia nova SH22a]